MALVHFLRLHVDQGGHGLEKGVAVEPAQVFQVHLLDLLLNEGPGVKNGLLLVNGVYFDVVEVVFCGEGVTGEVFYYVDRWGLD